MNDGGRYNPAVNTWTAVNTTGAPAARSVHTAIGARYSPASNTWSPTNPSGAPAARSGHTAVATGTRIIVFGGSGASNGSPGGTGIAGTNGYGIDGSSNQYAGWFAGAVNITGSLFKRGGAFRIDTRSIPPTSISPTPSSSRPT